MSALYRIAEVAERFGISPSTLRQWEQHGLIRPARAASGYRGYSDEDLGRIGDIHRLRTVEGLNLAAIRALIGDGRRGGDGGAAAGRPAAAPPGVGPRLRVLRRQAGLSLEEAARRAGVSASALSRFERTSAGASPAFLRTLARAYGTTVTDLMTPATPAAAGAVMRAGAARRLPMLGVGLDVAQLSARGAQMDCQLWTLEPGASSQGSYAHEGEEFIFVMEGRFEITLDGHEGHDLGPGDSIYFESRRFHAWRNPGEAACRILWVNTPPTF